MNTLTASTDSSHRRSTFLRRVLFVDAATCLATGALLAFGAAQLAGPLGLPAALLTYAGLSLFPCAALMLWIATRESIWRLGTWVVVLGNVGWVAGSIALLIELTPTGFGQVFVIAQGVVVALLADLEYAGLKRLG